MISLAHELFMSEYYTLTLKKQHGVSGLQDTIFAFEVEGSHEFVQCLNLSHWITVSTAGCPPVDI